VKSFVRFIVYSNIFVAFCVLGLSISSEILLDTANYKLSQFVFFATLFTYNFQRIVRLSKTREHARKDWLNKNKLAVFSLIVISAIMSGYSFFDFKTNTQVLIIFSGVISVLYPFGLRKIPFSKIFIISLIWTTSTMLLLVLEENISFSPNVVFHLLVRFLFVFAICIPFDIRDLRYDNIKLKTIPIIVGVSKSKFICFVSLFLIVIISIFQFWNYNLSIGFLIAIILSCIVSLIFINKSDEKKSDFFFSFWIESLSILLYLFLAISISIF
jgi:4-hydroxybenzoate polyprenyltransferase